MDYRSILTVELGKRGGKVCVRRLLIAVVDVLGWLAAGMSVEEILDDFPELTPEDIMACCAYAADRELGIAEIGPVPSPYARHPVDGGEPTRP